MKKFLSCSILILVLAVGISAQTFTPGLSGKGIKVGIGMATWTGVDLAYLEYSLNSDTKYLSRFAGGAFLTFSLSRMFAIQPEALLSMKGARWEDGRVTLTEKLTYLQIPILAKITFQTPGPVKPSLYGGPTIDFLLSAKESLEGTAGADGEMDVKDHFRANDVGVIFGLGLDVGAGDGSVTFDGRYEIGFTKIYRPIGGFTPDIKNGQFMFLIGYSF